VLSLVLGYFLILVILFKSSSNKCVKHLISSQDIIITLEVTNWFIFEISLSILHHM